MQGKAVRINRPWYAIAALMMVLVGIPACLDTGGSLPGIGTGELGISDNEPGTENLEMSCAPGTLSAGSFCVAVEYADGNPIQLVITHQSDQGRVIFDTVENQSFIVAAKGNERVRASRGSFDITDTIKKRCYRQTITDVSTVGPDTVVISGGFEDCNVAYTMTLQEKRDNHLGFDIALLDPNGAPSTTFNRVFFSHSSQSDERFFGFGQQYSFFDMKGKKLPIWTQEQGHGRGVQPLTWALNTFGGGAGGEWDTTYTSVPYYVSSRSRSLFLENYEYTEFDMTDEEQVTIMVFGAQMTGRVLNGATPLDVVSEYTHYTGRMAPLPTWTQEGAILRAYRGSDEVRAFVDMIQDADIPLAGLWVEDWMGRRQNWTGTRLWWNWQIDPTIYPDWEEFLAEMRDRGVRITTYFNPYLTDARRATNHELNLFEIAQGNDYFVKNKMGRVFVFGAGGFNGSIIDLTNPDAREWLKGIMIDQLQKGVSGWMADFGEAVPYDGQFYSGVDGEVYHNQYPAEWAKLNREAIAEAGLEGDAIFWTRSGNAKTPSYSTLAWLGDQTVTWDSFDGMKTVVTGLLSAGLSGYSIIHGDIGGYMSVKYPGIIKITRSKELLLRWIELGAFQSVFRTHDTLRPEINPQVYSDEETLDHFRRFAGLFTALAPYRQGLMEQANTMGYPVVRPVFLHYPEDPQAYDLDFQFMLGSDFLVAPVLDPGVEQAQVYLPNGKWVHLWTGVEYGEENVGTWVTIDAPIGSPPVFYSQGSQAGVEVTHALRAQAL